MNKHIDEVEFVLFDTETTGLDPACGDRVIELAGVRFRAQEVLGTFQTLINPGQSIPRGATAVNGISDEMVKDAPRIEEVSARFLDFIQGAALLSYNAPFDMKFLNSELKRQGQEVSSEVVVIDVLKMARKLLPGLERYALWAVAAHLGFKQEQEHRAFSDVELARAVFGKLKAKLLNQGVSRLENFALLFGCQPKFSQGKIEEHVTQIQEAIDLGSKLKITYLSCCGGGVSEREVLPKEIRREAGVAYFSGYCFLRQDERTFRVDGIIEMKMI